MVKFEGGFKPLCYFVNLGKYYHMNQRDDRPFISEKFDRFTECIDVEIERLKIKHPEYLTSGIDLESCLRITFEISERPWVNYVLTDETPEEMKSVLKNVFDDCLQKISGKI